MRKGNKETALASHLLAHGHEPSIDELLNDPVAEAIMRYDRITRDDVRRVISQVIVRCVALRKANFEEDPPHRRGSAIKPFAHQDATAGDEWQASCLGEVALRGCDGAA